VFYRFSCTIDDGEDLQSARRTAKLVMYLIRAFDSSRDYGTFPVRAIAQAVSLRLTASAARVRAWFRSSEIFGGQSGTGGSFSLSTSVSLANSHSTDCSTFVIIYHLGLVQQAKKWTQSHLMRKIKTNNGTFPHFCCKQRA
jgi:hypothetical protein